MTSIIYPLPHDTYEHSTKYVLRNCFSCCYYRLNVCVLPKLICWNPNPRSYGIWNWHHAEAITFNEILSVEPPWCGEYPHKEGKRHQSSPFLQADVPRKGQMSHHKHMAIQKPGRMISLEPNHAETLILESSLQNCDKINVSCLSHTISVMFLQ